MKMKIILNIVMAMMRNILPAVIEIFMTCCREYNFMPACHKYLFHTN